MPENSGMMHCGILFSTPYFQHIATKLDRGRQIVSALPHSNSGGVTGYYMYKSDNWSHGIVALCYVNNILPQFHSIWRLST